MPKFIASARRFLAGEDAPTMLEYGLLIALIALVVAAAAQILGSNVSSFFNTAAGSV
jgi:pilus assembly protein Flp/PilA